MHREDLADYVAELFQDRDRDTDSLTGAVHVLAWTREGQLIKRDVVSSKLFSMTTDRQQAVNELCDAIVAHAKKERNP